MIFKYVLMIIIIFSINTEAISPIKHLQNNTNSTKTKTTDNCNYYTTCNDHGVCHIDPPENSYLCKCDNGYTTHECDDGSECCYEQKKQLVAFLLHIFLGGVGAGDFYLGNIDLGLIPLAMITGGFCGVCILAVCASCICENSSGDNKSVTETFFQCLYGLCFIVMAVIWLWRLIVICIGEATDGNEVEMAKW